MNITRDITLGQKIIHLSLNSLVQHRGGYCFQFGIGGKRLQSYGKMTIENNEIIIESNCFAGQRIYYWELDNDIYVTDNVNNYVRLEELNEYQINEFENTLFLKHGYTSGDSTRYDRIKKLPPSSKLVINSNGTNISTNWTLGNVKNAPDAEKYIEAIENAVIDNLSCLKEEKRPVALCFSGGKDSTYIAAILQRLGIEHDLVFFQDKNIKINNIEIKKAKSQALKFGKTLRLIDITGLKNPEIETAISNFNIFDRHYCRYHFYGIEELRKIYGKELIVINGQNSDSILSYGPSESKFSSKIKRYLLYGNNLFLKSCIAMAIGIMFRKRLWVPLSKDEKREAFYDNFKYCLLLDKRSYEYKKSLLNKIKSIINNGGPFFSENNIYMFLKSFTHMQGPDAQVVTQSAKRSGIDLLMPLATKEVMEATLRFKDDRMELHHPKYCLDSICENL